MAKRSERRDVPARSALKGPFHADRFDGRLSPKHLLRAGTSRAPTMERVRHLLPRPKSISHRLPKNNPAFVEPMKALLTEELPKGPDWIYELKFDGVSRASHQRQSRRQTRLPFRQRSSAPNITNCSSLSKNSQPNRRCSTVKLLRSMKRAAPPFNSSNPVRWLASGNRRYFIMFSISSISTAKSSPPFLFISVRRCWKHW